MRPSTIRPKVDAIYFIQAHLVFANDVSHILRRLDYKFILRRRVPRLENKFVLIPVRGSKSSVLLSLISLWSSPLQRRGQLRC